MGKKNKDTEGSFGKKGKKGKIPFIFLDFEFGNIDQNTVKRHILFLILASLLTKFTVLILTPLAFHSFIDLFDIGFYFEHAIKMVQGQLPYINYSFDYPILIFIPITIALIPALAFQSAMAFVYTFQLLMVLCDIVTILCIYFIALKVWDEKIAFYSGLIYATAFSTAYFVLTKYDAFPTCLLMVAVLCTVYGMNMRGYLFAALGFFAKIFPAIAFPFMVFYNAKTTSIKQEAIAALKVVVPLSLILFVPLVLIRPDVIRTYLFATGSSVGIYVNTATFTLYAYLQEVGHLGITSSMVSTLMYVMMGIVFLILVYTAYIDTEKRPVTFLKILLCAILALVVFTKFHSPQYIVWFTPFLCLLVADNLYKIILFYVTQVFAYIEFPLMFGRFYTNLEYVNPAGSAEWYLTLFFFTVEYLALLILVYLIIRPPEGLVRKIEEKIHRT
ncbi:MAG: hypothetical protein NTV10_04075 [Methanoregula sp.]|jgi:hypothetical protein|nr:hypothetical protein [Methanoregula sp.]